MTFIKGPVCRGQVALNVINDHFWVMFVDPKHDILSKDKDTYNKVADITLLPAQVKNDLNPFISFRKRYWKAVQDKYQYMTDHKFFPQKEWLWDGEKENTNALLTIFRHYNSAKVLRGLQGEMPKTVWVIDYHVFESIYYNLTASYNVFGPLLHQLHSRLYMEISRIASEDFFLTMLPKEVRVPLRTKWNTPVPKKETSIIKEAYNFVTVETAEKMRFNYGYEGPAVKTLIKYPKKLKIEEAKQYFFDNIASEVYSKKQISPRGYPKVSPQLFDAFDIKSKRAEVFPDSILIRLKKKNGADEVYTVIHNKAHYNVSMLFFESSRRNVKEDSLTLIPGVATSYPNLYVVLEEHQLDDLKKGLKSHYKSKAIYKELRKYSIQRSHLSFWEHHIWFSHHTKNELTNEVGLLDLNRYENL